MNRLQTGQSDYVIKVLQYAVKIVHEVISRVPGAAGFVLPPRGFRVNQAKVLPPNASMVLPIARYPSVTER